MSFSVFGNLAARRAMTANKTRPVKAYDDLAGSRLLRHAGKADPLEKTPWCDLTPTILADPAKTGPEDKLDRQLRNFYQSLTREPVPERFIQLVSALESEKKRWPR
jgi:hypothetical protein